MEAAEHVFFQNSGIPSASLDPAVTRGLTLAYPTALFAVSHPSVLLPQYIPRSAVKG